MKSFRLSVLVPRVAMVLVCFSAGCGSGRYAFETVPVEGTVTLNGEPLPDALVTFHPENGRLASGKTDKAGEYKLVYLEGKSGVLPGKHKVTISTNVEPDRDSDDPEVQAGRPEVVPANYNRITELEVTVSLDEQSPVDFDLEGTVPKNRKGRGGWPR